MSKILRCAACILVSTAALPQDSARPPSAGIPGRLWGEVSAAQVAESQHYEGSLESSGQEIGSPQNAGPSIGWARPATAREC